MADVLNATTGYQAGESYTPADPTDLARVSRSHQIMFERQHDWNTGEHTPDHIAKAGASVRWTGAAYVLDRSEGVLGVVRLALGVVRFTFSFSFLATNAYIIIGDPMVTSSKRVTIFEAQDAAVAGAKALNSAAVRIWDRTAVAYADLSFGMLAYGRK